MKFRIDINALRCTAVLQVVFFHFQIPYFDAGFVGVDIFFAISGYLMTAILMSSNGSFVEGVVGFYVARTRRIIPGLLVLCMGLAFLGWWLLDPFAYKELGKEIRMAILFKSNFHFWKEAGYFESAAHDKWLLHSWSLSVEWQFYLIYPLVFGALQAMRASRRKICSVLWAITIVSLAFTLLGKVDDAFCYYLLPTRAWEMTAGGIAFLCRRNASPLRWGSAIAAIAWATVVLSGIFLPASARWPNAWSLIPVVGTSMLLWLNQPQNWQRITLVSAVGRWSYSIYLWHWPLVVFFRYWLERQPNVYESATGIVIIMAVGALSYRLVEVKTRQMPVWNATKARIGAVAGLLAAGWITGSIAVLANASPLRVSDSVIAVRNDAVQSVGSILQCTGIQIGDMSACRYGTGPLKAIVLGDSHSKAIVPAVIAETEGAVINIAMNSCPTVFRSDSPECNEFAERATKSIREAALGVPVIVVNRMALYRYGHTMEKRTSTPPSAFASHDASSGIKDLEYLSAYSEALCTINDSAPVYALYPVPEFTVAVPKAITKRVMLFPGDGDISVPKELYLARNGLAIEAINHASRTCGVHVIDPTPYLCSESRCFGTDNQRPLYIDENHLSPYGNDHIRRAFGVLKS